MEEYADTEYGTYGHFLLATYKASSTFRSVRNAYVWAQDDSTARDYLDEAVRLFEDLRRKHLPDWLAWRTAVALARCYTQTGNLDRARGILDSLEVRGSWPRLETAVATARRELKERSRTTDPETEEGPPPRGAGE